MFFALVLLLALTPSARMEEARPIRGHSVARVSWVDETGARHSLGELAGYPVILLPMYSECRGTCPTNIRNLKRALSEANVDPKEFRVLLFSFDSSETPARLAQLRGSEQIPLAWSLAAADAGAIEALTESIGFQFGRNGDQFMHPNVAVFLDRRLAVADWIYGSNFSAAQVERGLKAANGEDEWLARHAVGLYGVVLFLFSAFLIGLLSLLLLRRRAVRQEFAAAA